MMMVSTVGTQCRHYAAALSVAAFSRLPTRSCHHGRQPPEPAADGSSGGYRDYDIDDGCSRAAAAAAAAGSAAATAASLSRRT